MIKIILDTRFNPYHRWGDLQGETEPVLHLLSGVYEGQLHL